MRPINYTWITTNLTHRMNIDTAKRIAASGWATRTRKHVAVSVRFIWGHTGWVQNWQLYFVLVYSSFYLLPVDVVVECVSIFFFLLVGGFVISFVPAYIFVRRFYGVPARMNQYTTTSNRHFESDASSRCGPIQSKKSANPIGFVQDHHKKSI